MGKGAVSETIGARSPKIADGTGKDLALIEVILFSISESIIPSIAAGHPNLFLSSCLNFLYSTVSFASFIMSTAPPPTSTGSSTLDKAKQVASANTPEKLSGFALYSRFALAGAVCCSVTHGGLTPVDV